MAVVSLMMEALWHCSYGSTHSHRHKPLWRGGEGRGGGGEDMASHMLVSCCLLDDRVHKLLFVACD